MAASIVSVAFNRLRRSALTLATLQATSALAAQPDPATIRGVEEIVVQGGIGYRNRSNDVVQTLEYGLDYFQRFEPLTAGDALKRMPSVTFLSDVIESDGVRMRGLERWCAWVCLLQRRGLWSAEVPRRSPGRGCR